MRGLLRSVVAACFCLAIGPVFAQDIGTLDPKPLPPLSNPSSPSVPAKQLFGRELAPTHGPAHIYGFYSHGCLAGAVPLPLTGDAWQVMRPSRDRNWGDPVLIAFLERMARADRAAGIWPGLLVGDIAQPRGGPMLNGHASHQLGIDADIWLRPMPSRILSRRERETMMSVNVVRPDRLGVNQYWNEKRFELIRSFAEQKEVQRIFVNPAIKKAMCRETRGDRSWLSKVRPMYGHDYHFHVRLACPAGARDCQHQTPPPARDGCGKSLAWWFRDSVLHPRPNPHWKPRPPITMASLPKACRRVLTEP